jgi:hypothetical protein
MDKRRWPINRLLSQVEKDSALSRHRQEGIEPDDRGAATAFNSTYVEEVIEFTEPFTFVLEHGMAMLKGKVALNPDYLNRARLKFQYWPDAANRPGLTLTPRPNGIDFQEVRD